MCLGYRAWNRGLVWVGRDLKAHLIPPPAPSPSPGCSKPYPTWTISRAVSILCWPPFLAQKSVPSDALSPPGSPSTGSQSEPPWCFFPSYCSTQCPNSLSPFCCLHFHCRDTIVGLKVKGSGWEVKLFRSPGDRTEQFILPGLIVQDFAASDKRKSSLSLVSL